MYVMMAWIVVLFWIVGILTGMASTIFLLDLEEKYILQPVKYFVSEIKNRFARVVSSALVSSKKAFRTFSTSVAEIPRAVHVIR